MFCSRGLSNGNQLAWKIPATDLIVRHDIPLNIVQRWLGDARIETTAIYAGAIGEEERNLARRAWSSLELTLPDRSSKRDQGQMYSRLGQFSPDTVLERGKRLQRCAPCNSASGRSQSPFVLSGARVRAARNQNETNLSTIGLIGFGAIGSAIAANWPFVIDKSNTLAAILLRPNQVAAATTRLPASIEVATDIDHFLSIPLDVVLEAAGHAAIVAYAERILRSGCDLHILSVGALADPEVQDRLQRAAFRDGGRIVIPSGALAGFDGLQALRVAGLTSVKYISAKPAIAWKGTSAEREGKLAGLVGPRIIFQGSARDAATAYPRNANLAAAVALAGVGFERTDVELIADPLATENSGRILAVSPAGTLDLTVIGAGFADNLKSSQLTAMSMLASVSRLSQPIVFT